MTREGDGVFCPEDYDMRPRKHTHGAKVFADAARSLGVTVTEREVDYWRSASLVAAALDGLVDEVGVEDLRPVIDSLFSGKPIGERGIMTPDDAALVVRVYESLSQQRKEAWHAGIEGLPLYADERRGAQGIRELIAVNFGEADRLYTPANSLDEWGDDRDARGRFNEWLMHFARAGYSVDGAVDMPRDYRNGLIIVRPTVRHRFEMLQAGWPSIVRGFRGLGAAAVCELMKTSGTTLREATR